MIRHNDWEVRLAAYLEGVREDAFVWGKHDCCTFSAGAVKAMTGVDLMRGFRGYRNEQAALTVLRDKGAGTLPLTVDRFLKRIPVGRSVRGDIVMAYSNLGIAMGVFSIHVGEVNGKPGLLRFPRADWDKAWRIPMSADHG